MEYKRYMIMYVRELANSGDEARLREVFDDLLGPSKAGSQAQQQDGGWQPQVGREGPALRAEERLAVIAALLDMPVVAAVAVTLWFGCCSTAWYNPHAAVEYTRLQVLERAGADALVTTPIDAAQQWPVQVWHARSWRIAHNGSPAACHQDLAHQSHRTL